MITINDALLVELGLFGLPGHLNDSAKAAIYAGLEMRVGTRIASDLSDEELDQVDAFSRAQDEVAALKWLEVNVPHYRTIVAEEFEIVCSSIAKFSGPLRTLLKTKTG